MKNLLLFVFFLVTFFDVRGQAGFQLGSGESLLMKEHILRLNAATYEASPLVGSFDKAAGPIFDTTAWAQRVNSTWGSGSASWIKHATLNAFWNAFDSTYDCFVQLPPWNWDSIITVKRNQVSAGVSTGRFAGIMGDLMGYINDGHTHFYDNAVNFGSITLGKPVFRGEAGTVGACLTPLNDSLPMVYEAEANHPFNLQRGDIVLGYNDMPWKELVKIVLRHELPNSVYRGSTDAATWHRYVQAALSNWHLFDTINIRKCDGSLQNFSTSLMTGRTFPTHFCNEELPVPGVPKLSYSAYYSGNIKVSSGVISGTRIGYVCMFDFSYGSGVGDTIYNAVQRLFEDSAVTGLVFDIRTNFGGSIGEFRKAFNYLHVNNKVSWVGYGVRTDPQDRMAMTNTGLTSWYDIYDNDPNQFNYPIAVLCGPNAISSGDLFPVLYRHHPELRLFGKSTAGAYGSYMAMTMPYAGYNASRQEANFFAAEDPAFYLSHTMYPIDFPMWFNQSSICNGTDNMLDSAVKWIQSGGASGMQDQPAGNHIVTLFPNPSDGITHLEIMSAVKENIRIAVYDVAGRIQYSFVYDLTAGKNAIDLGEAGSHLEPGQYFVRIEGKSGAVVKKMMIAR